MKFKLLKVAPSEAPLIEIDEYVPLTLQWPSYFSLDATPESWMVGVGESLVEIKTCPATGVLVEIILVDAKGVQQEEGGITIPPDFDQGFPILGIEEPEKHQEGEIHSYADGLKVLFMKAPVSRIIGDGGVFFGFSVAGYLVYASVTLEGSDRNRLHEVLG
ncbi:hypothetical protein SMD44_p20034 (plasmid) [Streptomyces alboflavus]|uniref:Uncharacterized protein n=1 Tax=Streptomyces alboflavus TaxID=67267 RepID=A0A291W4H0_9ACTN|nr:hypothetical protein [Streptomyces alboflavus]ATM24817.1 hypothetical protein SMD44_p20034 [Streptomyces alboflavus]